MATMNPSIDRRQTPDRRAALREGHSAMSAVDYIAMVLLIVGGLNWGMVGLFGVDVVASLFGTESAISRVIYTLVGIAALYSIYLSAKMATSKRL
jgi:uncharacterized protein